MADLQVLWTAPDGTVLDLTDESAGYSVLADGTRGLRSVTYETTSQKYAAIDGETLTSVRAAVGQPTVGMLVQADGEEEFQRRARRLVRAMRPKAGPGRLTVVRGDGTARTLVCSCVAGLEGDESPDATLPGAWWRLILRFYAEDPWWVGDQRSIRISLGAATNFFPFPPLALASSTVAGTFTVDLSDTDEETFPLWTIDGPGTLESLTNESTGQSIAIGAPLLGGQQIVIDTRRGYQSVHRGDLPPTDPNWNRFRLLTGDPALWPLTDDVNVITAAMTGAADTTQILGVYSPRYAGI